jgi:tryptophan synthase alpha subunit
MLESYLKERLEKKGILLMTHIVIGYPPSDPLLTIPCGLSRRWWPRGWTSWKLQIPFSEPIADGPVILQANQMSLDSSFGVKDKADVDFLKGKVDIAVIGTQTIRLVENQGVGAVGKFIQGLR